MTMRDRKKPKFLRQEWFRFGNTRKKWLKWRSPKGNQSKLRMHIIGKGFMPTPGYGTPAELRGLHPCGLKEIIVNNIDELRLLDAKTCAARVAGGVGSRKRAAIQQEAERMKIRILNPKKTRIIEKKATTPSKPTVSKEKTVKPEANVKK